MSKKKNNDKDEFDEFEDEFEEFEDEILGDDSMDDEFEDDDSEWDDDDDFVDDNNKSGGGAAKIIISLVVVAALAGGGFYLWKNMESNDYLAKIDDVTKVTETITESNNLEEVTVDQESLIIDDLPPMPDNFDDSIGNIQITTDDMIVDDVIEDTTFADIPAIEEDIDILDIETDINEHISDDLELNQVVNEVDTIDLPSANDISLSMNDEEINIDDSDIILGDNVEIIDDIISEDKIVETSISNDTSANISTAVNQELIDRIETMEKMLDSKIQDEQKSYDKKVSDLQNKIKQLEKKLSTIEKQKIIPKVEEKAEIVETVEEPVKIVEKAKPVKWLLKSAKIGKAWIVREGSNDIIVIEEGMFLPSIGRVISISNEEGRWIVKGTVSNINQ